MLQYSRDLYRVTIYWVYRYFGYTIHIVSFILVTRYFTRYIMLKFRIFGNYNTQTPVKFVAI